MIRVLNNYFSLCLGITTTLFPTTFANHHQIGLEGKLYYVQSNLPSKSIHAELYLLEDVKTNQLKFSNTLQ